MFDKYGMALDEDKRYAEIVVEFKEDYRLNVAPVLVST